jgi:hypothetical protein
MVFNLFKGSVADPDVLGLPDLHSDTFFTCTNPDLEPDPSIIKQKSKKNLDFYGFVTSV